MAAAERMAALDPKNVIMVQNPLATAHVMIGGILKEQGDHVQAMKELMAGLEIFRRLADQDPSNAMFQFQVAGGSELLAAVLLAQKKYDEALQAYAGARDILEHLVAKSPDNRIYQSSLVGTLMAVPRGLFLLTRRPKRSDRRRLQGNRARCHEGSVKINLAHAYLLTNQFEKAKAIYLENKDVKRPDGRGFAQVVLKDFQDLKAAGVSHPDMKKIERLVTGKSSAKLRN